jgi:uncharacterized membrane protein YhaH (DUF805 family)
MGDMFKPFLRFLDFSGRSRRREYWLFILLYTVAVCVATVLDIQLGLGGEYTSYSDFGDGYASAGFNVSLGPVAIGTVIVFLIPLLSVTVRRMHDVDKSGWFMLIPIYNFILTCIDGTRGPNRFGPDPKGGPETQIFS